ncbi:MAG: hypothetical protein VX346_06585 [Planctomycetota bacterium]|nr:hypothetical protein [Planctomycetota bacterium]
MFPDGEVVSVFPGDEVVPVFPDGEAVPAGRHPALLVITAQQHITNKTLPGFIVNRPSRLR